MKGATAGLSAASAYWSYQALKQDPVQVTTLARECIWFRYVSVPDAEWASLSLATRMAIAMNNRNGVESCGIEKPGTREGQ